MTLITEGAQRFLAAEAGELVPPAHPPASVNVGAVGTVAPTMVKGALLGQAITGAGLQLGTATPFANADELFADPDWHLGVVLSPWKQQIGTSCNHLAPSAAATGVVDSVLRLPDGAVGFNTNTWAAQSALEVVAPGPQPQRVLLLGSGGSARSAALAVTRLWPTAELVVGARRRAAATELADRFGGRVLDDLLSGEGWQVVVNSTTWGETEASESEAFGFDFERIFAPGGRLFDLNNRVSALQAAALAAGCAVIGGGVMQRVTNACRAALLRFAA